MARKLVKSAPAPLRAWRVDSLSVHTAPDRLDVALIAAAGCALLAPAVSLALGISPAWLPGSNALWRAAHLSAFDGLAVGPFTGSLATQTLVFIFVALIWRAVAHFGPQAGWALPELRADSQARDLFDPEGDVVLIYLARRQRTLRILVAPSLRRDIPPEVVEQACAALRAAMAAGDEEGGLERARTLLSPPRHRTVTPRV